MSLNLPESAEAVLGLRLYRGLKVRRLTRRLRDFSIYDLRVRIYDAAVLPSNDQMHFLTFHITSDERRR